jgi:hypothetical protein
VRAKLLFACLALGGCVNGTAALKTDAQPAPAAEDEMAKYTANVGKDYWVTYRLRFCAGATSMNCQFIDVGTHLKIDGLVPNQAPDGRPIFDPYYHAVLDDGHAGYVSVGFLSFVTDVNPTVAAADCKRRGDPHVGMKAAQVEATCWGKPNHINRKESAHGIHEQYVYGDGRFVYLHNGVVTEVQIRATGRQQP